MPVTLRHTLPGGSFALWRINEDTARLASLCTGQENAWAGRWLRSAVAANGSHGMPRCTRKPLPRKRSIGRPERRPCEAESISPSATPGGYAALMLCDVPCGLDIERADRDFTKTEERFLAPDERKLLGIRGAVCPPVSSGAPRKRSTNGRDSGGLDWLRDIRVTKIDPVRETLEGTAGGKRIGLRIIPHPELHIVFCAG